MDSKFKLREKRTYKAPENTRIYAVGDIHGEREMLDELLASLPLVDGDRFVFVGDYVDRGPDSRVDGPLHRETLLPLRALGGPRAPGPRQIPRGEQVGMGVGPNSVVHKLD